MQIDYFGHRQIRHTTDLDRSVKRLISVAPGNYRPLQTGRILASVKALTEGVIGQMHRLKLIKRQMY